MENLHEKLDNLQKQKEFLDRELDKAAEDNADLQNRYEEQKKTIPPLLQQLSQQEEEIEVLHKEMEEAQHVMENILH